MKCLSKYLLLPVFYFLVLNPDGVAQKPLRIYGKVINKDNGPVNGALVQILNSNYNAITGAKGSFEISLPHKQHISLLVKHTSFNNRIKELEINEESDSISVTIQLSYKLIPLDPVSVISKPKPDTLVYSGKFSIYDFDFYEDRYILLTAEKGLDNAEIKLSDHNG